MFSILGVDGKEYGPVSVDQVKAWISEGRANLDTKVKRAGDAEWIRLGDLPEFTGVAALVPPPVSSSLSAPSATGAAVDPKAYAAEVIARAAKLSIGDCIGRSWELLKANLWLLVGSTFVIAVISGAIAAVPVLGSIANFLLTGVFYGGLYRVFLLRLRGQPATVGDVFAGFNLAFAPLLLTSLVSSLLTGFGLLLLLLPGIYLAVSYSLAYLLVIDKKLEFWTAMEVSRRVVTSQWWRVFGLCIVAGLIACLGVIGLIIGIFFTLPIAFGATVCAYEHFFGTAQKPAASSTNP